MVQAEVAPSPAIPSWCGGPRIRAVGLGVTFGSFGKCCSRQNFYSRVAVGDQASGGGQPVPMVAWVAARALAEVREAVLRRFGCPHLEAFPSSILSCSELLKTARDVKTPAKAAVAFGARYVSVGRSASQAARRCVAGVRRCP